MKKFVIIVAGGNGSRMKTAEPKQFLLIHGKPILLHTVQKFIQALPDISVILVLPKKEMQRWEETKKEYNFTYPIQIATGGSTRFESVQSGLNEISEEGVVGIHDAVRPLVSVDTIQNCFKTAEGKGSAVPVIELKDSIRHVWENSSIAVPRDNFRIVQTPQCFAVNTIKQAFQKADSNDFTDDASLFEAAGYYVNLVEGNPDNLKITTVGDLKIAEALLSASV